MANRIKILLKEKDWTLEDLAAETGLSASFLSRMQNSRRGLSLEHVIKVARALGREIEEVTDEFHPDDLSLLSGNVIESIAGRTSPRGDVENLRIHSGAGGGGALSVQVGEDGYVADPAMSDGFWTFPESIKAGWQQLSKIKALPVTGDSMEPTLAKGSTVFVDTTHTHPNPEDIYAVDLGDGLNIKRLKLKPRSKKVLVYSDNAAKYGTEPDELNREDVTVYGRVVAWFQWRG